MEIVGVTRVRGGKEVDEFVVGCPDHGYWYKGRPPLTAGCRECWHAYYFAQAALAGGDFNQNIDQLESAIRHAAELASKGQFDFKPGLADFSIEKDASDSLHTGTRKPDSSDSSECVDDHSRP